MWFIAAHLFQEVELHDFADQISTEEWGINGPPLRWYMIRPWLGPKQSVWHGQFNTADTFQVRNLLGFSNLLCCLFTKIWHAVEAKSNA